MLNNFFISALVGALLGYLSGLGVGGGSLLILWLSLAVGMDSETASSINLMFFITAAGTVSIFRWKKGTLSLRKICPAILAGCISAALISLVARQIDSDLIKKIFGGLLVLIGLHELCYRPRKAK